MSKKEDFWEREEFRRKFGLDDEESSVGGPGIKEGILSIWTIAIIIIILSTVCYFLIYLIAKVSGY